MKRNEVRPVTGKWVKLEVIILKNRSVSERQRSHLLSFSFMGPRFYKDRQNYACTHTQTWHENRSAIVLGEEELVGLRQRRIMMS